MDSINTMLRAVFTDQVSVFFLVGAILLAMAEIGYRLGLRLHHAGDDSRAKQIELVQGSVLGLMSLLLGFTFAMAVQRFDDRKAVVVSEANAIGTAYLRASFLPDASKFESEDLYRRYTDLRLRFMTDGLTAEGLAAHQAEAAKLQRRLWTLVSQAGRETPNTMISSYAAALNEVIDLDALRMASFRNHVPGAVWLLLLALTSAGCWLTGYRAGAAGRRTRLSLIALPILITVVITLISDLDHPRQGLIGLDERSLQELRASLGEASPEPPPP